MRIQDMGCSPSNASTVPWYRSSAETSVLMSASERATTEKRSPKETPAPREMQRRAQFYLDFVEAENSTGFHAPQEATRILGEALDYARQGQLALRDTDFAVRIAPPSRN